MHALATLLFLLMTLCVSAQFSVRSREDSYVPLQTNVPSYTVFLQITWLDETSPRQSKKLPKIRIETDKGLLKKQIDYCEMSRNACRIVRYFYRDTFQVKCIVTYPMKKRTEVYHYRYSFRTHALISERGISNRTLIYNRTRKQHGDTTVTHTYTNYDHMEAKEKELEYSSKDSLMQTRVLYPGQWADPVYTIKKFDATHRLPEETDSGSDRHHITRFVYDSLGRLDEVLRGDSLWTSVTKYCYGRYENRVCTYNLYAGAQMQPQSEWLQRFNAQGALYQEEIIEYDKPEGITGTDKKDAIQASAGLFVKKYYRHNRLQKIEMIRKNVSVHTYTFKYVH